MDIIDLIPVLMFLVFFLILIAKIRQFQKSLAEKPDKKLTQEESKKKHTPEKLKKKSPWSQILGDLAAQVKEQLEAQKIAAEKESPLKRLLKSGKPVTKSKPVVIWEKNQELQPPPKTAPKSVAPLPSETTEPPEMDVADKAVDGTQKEKSTTPGSGKPMSLADAVVWSEILGPPLALRQDEKHLHNF